MSEILREYDLSTKEITDGLAIIIGRQIFPGSELFTVNYLKNKSSFDEILGTDFSELHKTDCIKFLI